MIIQVNPAHPSPYQIERLVTYLDDDGVIAVPTDTTYALACRPTKKNALEKLIRLRQLDRKKSPRAGLREYSAGREAYPTR